MAVNNPGSESHGLDGFALADLQEVVSFIAMALPGWQDQERFLAAVRDPAVLNDVAERLSKARCRHAAAVRPVRAKQEEAFKELQDTRRRLVEDLRTR